MVFGSRSLACTAPTIVPVGLFSSRLKVASCTTGGSFFYITGKEFEETDAPERLDTPYGSGVMNRFQYVGNPDGVFLISNKGKIYGIDNRMIPEWMGESDVRQMGAVFPFETDEQIWFAIPRSAMSDGRFIHITKNAKGKASEVSQYGRALDREGKEAFLLNGDDVPVAALYGPTDSFVFCASAQGQGIGAGGDGDFLR